MAPLAAITKCLLPALLWLMASAALAQSGADADPSQLWADRTSKGMAAASAGRQSEALTLLRAALLAAQRLGDEDPRLATAKSNLALLRLSSGDFEGAGPLLEEALELRIDLLGNEHGRVADSLIDLAAYQKRVSDLATAELTLGKALAIRELLYGPADPRSLAALDQMMSLAIAGGKYGEAIRLGRRALSTDGGASSDEGINRRQRLAALFAQSRQWADAEETLKQALKLRETRSLQIDLATAIAAQGRIDEALAILGDSDDGLLLRLSFMAERDPVGAKAALENKLAQKSKSNSLQILELALLDAEIDRALGNQNEPIAKVDLVIERLRSMPSAKLDLLADALIFRARLHREARNFEQALDDLNGALKLMREPDFASVPPLETALMALVETQDAAGLADDAQISREKITEVRR